MFYTSGLLALPLWYCIGRWIDHVIGLLPVSDRRGRGTDVLVWTFTRLSLAALALSVLAAIVNHDRGDEWLAVTFIVWSALFVVVMTGKGKTVVAENRKLVLLGCTGLQDQPFGQSTAKSNTSVVTYWIRLSVTPYLPRWRASRANASEQNSD